MNYDGYPKNRKEAQRLGATHYYTGVPCIRGHVCLRKTKGNCIECMREDWSTDNAKRAQKPKSEAAKSAGRKYYLQNKEVVKARAASRPAEEKRAYKRKYKEKNPEMYKALTSVRRRRHRNATPKWLSVEEKRAIRQLYLKAMELTNLTGVRYVVDHVIPLQGDTVCGLHILANLQIMTQEENLKKSNKRLDTP